MGVDDLLLLALVEEARGMKRRLVVMFGMVLLGFLVVAFRCWQLQVRYELFFESRALDNQLRRVPVPARRGDVYDRNGALLATSRLVYDVKLIDPSRPVARSQVELLASILGLDEEEVKKNFSPPGPTTIPPCFSRKT